MKQLYYILNFTWGIIMNLIGAIGAGIMLILGKKPIRHAGSIVFRAGHNWGGVSLGIFSFVCEEAGEHTLNHEFGHSLQNALYGLAFPFIVAIPSFVRYHKFNYNQKHGIPNEDYDAAWFEGQATDWGTKMAKKWQ
jgi:hypothetical protein